MINSQNHQYNRYDVPRINTLKIPLQLQEDVPGVFDLTFWDIKFHKLNS